MAKSNRNFNIFMPLVKVDVENRLVYGCIAEEVKDKSGEIMDYDTSKPNFESWSDMMTKNSGGLSVGNLRAMHAKVAAGKFTEIAYEDELKKIDGVAKVVDDQEWEKVLEGVYTGFSVGGSYAARWFDKTVGAYRYTAQPSEVSLADNPCMYGATLEFVKADGSIELKKIEKREDFMMNLQEILGNLSKDFSTENLQKVFSFEQITSLVRNAIQSKQRTLIGNDVYVYVDETFPDHIIIDMWDDGTGTYRYYSVEYTISEDGVVTLGDAVEVIRTTAYIVKGSDGTIINIINKTDGAKMEKTDGTEIPETAPVTVTETVPATVETTVTETIGDGTQLPGSDVLPPVVTIAPVITVEKTVTPEGLEKFVSDFVQGLTSRINPGQNSLGKTETPEVSAELSKTVENLVNEKMGGLEKVITDLKTANQDLTDKLNKIESQPAAGGPVSHPVEKTLAGDGANQDGVMLQGLQLALGKVQDPQVQQELRKIIATEQVKNALNK